jgi:hypothetical protein
MGSAGMNTLEELVCKAMADSQRQTLLLASELLLDATHIKGNEAAAAGLLQGSSLLLSMHRSLSEKAKE